jgi:3',5'-cyclic AMP phosphodiesterase CpdA
MNIQTAAAAVILTLLVSCSGDRDPSAALDPGFPFPSSENIQEWQPVFGQNVPPPDRITTYPQVRFMTVSDIHYLDPGLYDEGKAFRNFSAVNDGKMLTDGSLILDMIVQTAVAEKPDFLLVTGDLTVNGAEVSHSAVARAFRKIQEAGIPVFAIPGNHDVLNPWAAAHNGDRTERIGGISPETFRSIYAEAGFNAAVDSHSGSLSYIAEPVPGLRLLMLDSNLYEDNESKGYPQTDGFFSEDQARWIKTSLENAAQSGNTVIVGMHHSLLHHTGNGGSTMNSVTVYNWPVYFELFAEYQASLVFTGHIHAQDTAAMAVPDRGGFVYDASTGAAAVFPHSYRIISISNDGVAGYESGRLSDSLTGADRDTYLARARSLYMNSLVDRSVPRLMKQNNVDEEEARTMMAYIAALSLNHFAGEEQGDLPDHLYPEARRLWAQAADGGASPWLSRMGSDTAPKDNGIIIDLNSGMWKSDSRPGRRNSPK